MILSKPAMTPMSANPEADLVSRAREGDRAAQEELVRQHRRSAYFLALQLLGNPDDALDVTQDALLRFLTNLHRFDIGRPVKPWLYQIVRNRVMDLRRRQRVRRHDSIDVIVEDRPRLELVDHSVDPERDAGQSQLRRRVWKALRQLSDKQREILVLRDYQDLSYAEIAQTLEVPIGTVMSRLHAARKRLRDHVNNDLRSLNRWTEERVGK